MNIARENAPRIPVARERGDAQIPALRDVAAQFEALLLKEAFAPLSRAMGFYGDAMVTAATQAMTRNADAGLTAPLEAALSQAARDGGMR